MRDDDVLVIAGLVLLVMTGEHVPWGAGWVWPVPDVRFPDGRILRAQVSQEFKPSTHLGVDIMYRAGGVWLAPKGTPVIAAKTGRWFSSRRTARGWGVVIDHGAPFATYYQHLETVRPYVKGAVVPEGAVIGTMGADPTDPQGLRHLHFAVWYKGAGDKASVDPGGVIDSWRRPTPWDAP